MNKNKQQGFSLIKMMISIVLFGVIGVVGFQVGLAHMSAHNMKQAYRDTVASLSEAGEGITRSALIMGVEKRLSVDNLASPAAEDLDLTIENDRVLVDVVYIKEVSLSDKYKLVMDLSFQDEIPIN